MALRFVLILIWLALPLQAFGQAATPILTLDRARLFAETTLGQAFRAQSTKETQALLAENTQLEKTLTDEERDLTARRKRVSLEAFKKLAADFDARVELLRQQQQAKGQVLIARENQVLELFLAQTLPILQGILSERGAAIIIDRQSEALVVSFESLDITDIAINRLNEAFEKGQFDLP